MTDRWINYFRERLGKYRSFLEYSIVHWTFNFPLYFRIRQLIPPPAKILEVGCGLGPTTIYLTEYGYDTIGIDNDINIITQAKENAKSFHSSAKFEVGDAFNLAKYYHQGFDLVFSVGVVEHFEREKTVYLLREQVKCARYILAVVPTKYTKYCGITDERIYTLSKLAKVFQDAGLKVIRKFGYGAVNASFHNIIRRFLPTDLLYFLQNHLSYAARIGCIGKRKQ